MNNSNDLVHEDVYTDILRKWQKKNFNEVDQDHNSVWNLQGGTVGEATGILTEEEEKDYVNQQ